MTDLVASWKARLVALAAADRKEYRLGKPVTAAKLAAFEAANEIELPEPYRTFLRVIGEGAAGPVYGMLSLAAGMRVRGKGIYTLADPFPAPTSDREMVDLDVGGVLPIQDEGCGRYRGLIVTGPERGQVWSSIDDRPGWVPLDGPKSGQADLLLPKHRAKRATFAPYYAAWLDEAEGAA